jgi:hypothetical protein
MRAFVVFATLIAATSIARATPVVTLTTVDEIERTSGQNLSITGIPSGQSTSQTFQIYTPPDSGSMSSGGDACERAALMMMNRPGRWALQINQSDYYYSCRLIKQ